MGVPDVVPVSDWLGVSVWLDDEVPVALALPVPVGVVDEVDVSVDVGEVVPVSVPV